jgi:hypothetical protein
VEQALACKSERSADSSTSSWPKAQKHPPLTPRSF